MVPLPPPPSHFVSEHLHYHFSGHTRILPIKGFQVLQQLIDRMQMLLVDSSKVQYLSVLSSNFHASSPVLPTAITCDHICLGRDVIDMT